MPRPRPRLQDGVQGYKIESQDEKIEPQNYKFEYQITRSSTKLQDRAPDYNIEPQITRSRPRVQDQGDAQTQAKKLWMGDFVF